MQTCVSELMKCSILSGPPFQYGLYGCTIIHLTSLYWETTKLGCLPASSVIDTAVLRLRILGQTSQVSLLCHAQALGLWVLLPLCTSGSHLQNRKQQDLPHEVAVRTKVVSVASTLRTHSCSKMPIIIIVIIYVPHINWDKFLEVELQMKCSLMIFDK